MVRPRQRSQVAASLCLAEVRKTWTHALRDQFAAQLHSIDPVYAWRRLCVIALEDCFGDPLAAALTLEANRSFRFRQQLGELKVLAAAQRGWQKAPKVEPFAIPWLLGARNTNIHQPSCSKPTRSYKGFHGCFSTSPSMGSATRS